MAASTAVGSISAYVREELSFVRKECEPEVDGIFSEMYNSSAGVSRSVGRSAVGTDGTWTAIVSFSTGVAGAFRNVSVSGPATEDQAVTLQTNKWATGARTFPGISEVTSPGTVQKTITLVQGMGNFVLPFHYFQSDELDASIATAVDIVIRGTAKNVAQAEANMFYTNNAAVKPLATIVNTAGVSDVTSPTAMTWTIDDGTNIDGRIGRFLPGMTVDFYNSTDSDAVWTGGASWIVSKVDYVGKAVSFVPGDASTGITGTLVAGDYCIQGGSFGAASGNATFGPSGAETFLVDSGSPYGISLTTHPQFKSLVAAVSGVLDEATLNKYVGGFFDAYGGMYGLDSILTTTGVMTAYMEAIDGLYRYERNNSRLTLREGWSSMDYAWNGTTFKYLASRYQLPGQAYIMKLGDQNLKRYVPPSVMGTGKRGEFPRDIQFVAPWMGSKSIFLPATVDDEVSEFNQAPFVCFREWCPEQIPGIKLTALTEINP